MQKRVTTLKFLFNVGTQIIIEVFGYTRIYFVEFGWNISFQNDLRLPTTQKVL